MECRDVAARLLVGADNKRQIVVPVDQRDAIQKRPRALEHAHANSMIGASTASESPSFARILAIFTSRSARSTFSIFIASTTQSGSPALTSWPCFTEIAFTRPGMGQSRALVEAPTFLSGISAASSASRRV